VTLQIDRSSRGVADIDRRHVAELAHSLVLADESLRKRGGNLQERRSIRDGLLRPYRTDEGSVGNAEYSGIGWRRR
jgi:hypothetical protein